MFSSVFTKEPEGDTPTLERKEVKVNMLELKITRDNVMKLLMKLNVDKSPGLDNLHQRCMKETAETFGEPLIIHYNQSLRKSEVPRPRMTKRIFQYLVCVVLLCILTQILIRQWTSASAHIPANVKEKKVINESTQRTLPCSMEKPDIYLHANRFDLIVKIVYMYFHVAIKHIPQCILLSYTEHIRVWNGFKEYCNDKDRQMNDYYKPCKQKNSKEDFLKSYHNLTDNLRNYGFNPYTSSIPVDVNGFLINGAHRLSSSIVLSQYVCVQHLSYKKVFITDYKYFLNRGLQKRVIEMVVLEYMKIQVNLHLASQVTILSLFSKDEKKEKTMRSILRNKCSRDGFIVYEKDVVVTKLGMKQLIIHMYGLQTWIQAKINNMKNTFAKSDLAKLRFFFFFARSNTALKHCKNEIRMLYNDTNFKSSAHIPDTPHETLILAEMILNNRSLHLINNGNHTDKCLDIVTEISRNSFLSPINSLPGLYKSRQDVMLDSGIVLYFYGFRKETDVDVLLLSNVDKTIQGKFNGVQYQAHVFASNVVGDTRRWGEEHLRSNISKWELFYDPGNYGYCYGIKFVSLT